VLLDAKRQERLEERREMRKRERREKAIKEREARKQREKEEAIRRGIPNNQAIPLLFKFPATDRAKY